jgi:hypothetical protein
MTHNFTLKAKKVEEKIFFQDRRVRDPYVDRRSGEDQRKVYDAAYWDRGGTERRRVKDRRKRKERRSSCVRVTKWSSVCVVDKANQ